MPLPWKRTKGSRFSRMVADLQSPKRGNSLVVETGFPTSLVDLFHKNRERLRKPTAKKKKKRQQQLQEVEEELVISDPIPLSSSIDLVDLPEPIQNLEKMESFHVCELVSQLLPVVDDVEVANKKCWNDKEKRLLFVALKMFLVVVLGLSTKKLVVGITMSAFVLIFLEYVTKHVLCFLKPCLNVELVLESVFERVSSAFLILKGAGKCEDPRKGLIIEEIDQEDDHSGFDSCDLIETLEMKSSIEDIQVVEFNFDVTVPVQDNRGTESKMDLLSCDGRNMRVVEVEEDTRGVLVCEKERSRNSKIRRKFIKKLVPKKLRSSKNAKKSKEKEPDFGSESSSCLGDDEMGKIEVLEDGDKQGLENKGKALLSELPEAEEEEEINERSKGKEPDQGISSSSTGWQGKMEVAVLEEGKIERKQSLDYLILFFVALAGLVGGRSLSLVVTLASCSMIKLVRRYRCVNEPVNRSLPQSHARILGDRLFK